MQNSKVLDYFYQLKHAGRLDLRDPEVCSATVGQAEQNNLLQLFLRLSNNKIVEAKFMAYANPVLMGCCEYVCEELKGKTIIEAQSLSAQKILQALSMPSLQNHAAAQVERLLKTTIDSHPAA